MKSYTSPVVTRLLEREQQLSSERRTVDSVLQLISEFVLPNRGDFTIQRAQGQRADTRVFDTTAVHANEMLSSALYAGLINPSSQWFGLRARDTGLMENEDVIRWVADAERITYNTFSSSFGNFYQQAQEFLTDLVAYGTAIMFVDEEMNKGVRFSTRHLSGILIDEDSQGRVDTVYWKFKYTARQAAQRWSEEQLPDCIKKSLAGKPNEEFDFLHVVMPRADAERMDASLVSKIAKNQKFASLYICIKDKYVVESTGYYEMPYLVARWSKLAREKYGRSCAWNCLSDIRAVNVMKETLIRTGQLQGSPPMLVADDGVMLPLRTTPNSTIIGGIQDGKQAVMPLQVGGNMVITESMAEQARDAIRQSYFVDQFIPKQGTPVTATEAMQNQENRLRLLAPQVSRLNAEFVTPLVERVFSILQRSGSFPEAPEILDGVTLDIEFVSPLAKTQRFQELMALNRAVESISVLLQYQPNILDNVAGDQTFRDALDIAGFPVRNLKPVKERDDERQQKAEQEQQMQQAAMAMQGADTAANLQKSGINVVE